MDLDRRPIFKKNPDVNRRLKELGLSKSGLLEVRDRVLSQAANASPPLHPANAAGQFAYLEGVFALRDIFLDTEWRVESIRNMEFIRNDRLGLRVGYSNVKVACDDHVMPKARSPKGEIAEVVCSPTMDLFADETPSIEKPDVDLLAYFLMVDRKGGVELTCPTIENSNYRNYWERIYLSDGSDYDGEVAALEDDDDAVDDFDPVVARR